jgi:ferric-dicitrate binding protein FerR (iron transport regulator)
MLAIPTTDKDLTSTYNRRYFHMDAGNVVVFPNRSGSQVPKGIKPHRDPEGDRTLWVTVGFVAAACVAGVMILGFRSHNFEAPLEHSQTGTFSTQRGEHRCEKLPESSEVCLNTGTTVRYLFTGSARRLEVVTGEAAFNVRPDPIPFEVLSRNLLIRDVSTRFDVYRQGDSTLLTVLEGSVKVLARSGDPTGSKSSRAERELTWKSAPEFHRLQQVEFDESSGMLYVRSPLTEQGLSQFMAWQRGEVDLTNKPLWEVLRELARYQPTDSTFVLQDKEMRRMRLGGRLESTHMGDFLVWLEREHGIRHSITGGPNGTTVITLSRPRAAK